MKTNDYYAPRPLKGHFSVGTKVQLQPSDTYPTYAEILEINGRGYIFKIIEPSHENSPYSVGDIVFWWDSSPLVMKKI